MRRLRIPGPDLSKEEKTYLDADYSSGTALTVVNAIGFAGGEVTFWPVVGEPGEDKTEAQRVTSVTGSTVINISAALRFSHNKSTPVYRSPWNQVEIHRMRTGEVNWSIISQSNIQWDKNETLFIDDDGVSTDSYRFRFWNSISNIFSEYSPTVTGAGFARNQVGFMLMRVRKMINDLERKIITDEQIIEMLDTAQDLIKGVRQDWWFLLVDTFKAGTGLAASSSPVLSSVKSPGTTANSTVASSWASWTNMDNVKVSDNIYSTGSNSFLPLYDNTVSLVLADGSYGSENKASLTAWSTTEDVYYSYGSSTDLWGETLTPSDVNDSDFGVILQAGQDPDRLGAWTDYLKCTNFGFNIPLNATITGVLVEIERNALDVIVWRTTKLPQVDHIRITISYTVNAGVYSLASYTDFNFLESVRYHFNNGTDSILRHIVAEDALVFDNRVRDQDKAKDDQVEVYKMLPPDSSSDNGYIQVDPVPENAYGTLYPNYYKVMTTLNDVADKTPIPIPSVLEQYAVGQCERIKGNEKKAEIYESLFFGNPDKRQGIRARATGIELLERMQNSYTHPQGQPTSIKTWRGRKAMKDLMQDTSYGLSNDSLREKYFDFPRR